MRRRMCEICVEGLEDSDFDEFYEMCKNSYSIVADNVIHHWDSESATEDMVAIYDGRGISELGHFPREGVVVKKDQWVDEIFFVWYPATVAKDYVYVFTIVPKNKESR